MATAVSLKGVKTAFQPVPEGTYEVALKDYKVGPSKSTPGETSYNLTLAIQSPEDFMGQNLFYAGSLQAKALFGFKRAIAALGAPENALEGDSVVVEEILDDLKGNVAKVYATIEPGRDGPQNRVKFILADEENAATEAGGTAGKW